MQTSSTTTYSKNKQVAVRDWLEDIPATFVGNTTFSRVPISSVINKVPSARLCTMARSSERSLATLASSGTIVLFTPVVAVKATNKTSSSSNTDPFEILGRALSRYHKRIRHVPYHPKVGFTDTHDAFCSQADAVVVVMCEPAQDKAASLDDQIEFAESANDALKESMGGRPLKHPVALIQCGNFEGGWWPSNSAFETVLKCRTSDTETAQQVARKLFEAKK
ncbi:hypothetical protein Slin15195_G031260 [Septoria linicola]|uniref:Uncharacterized protein n=1 Tax=Septoria linicola TaxID=215465 RepID=A0A9Q9AIC9_9PEZI|nr:hypothetical protein Slin14017_G030280 [Septoria linicola]USW49807.1 hypothetical protein Slin15195_G031260 [Septoria linicola]